MTECESTQFRDLFVLDSTAGLLATVFAAASGVFAAVILLTYIVPAWRFESVGSRFTATRRRFGRRQTISGEWSQVTGLRVDYLPEARRRRSGKTTLIVELRDAGRLVIPLGLSPRDPVAFFSERSSLSYEWMLHSVADGRIPLEESGDYVRVARMPGPSSSL